MTLFQFLLILGVLIASVLAIRVLPGDRSLALKRILALMFALAAILAILFPAALTAVAKLLGIGRGADLLLYVFVLATLMFAVGTVRSKARSDARVTNLARAVALMEARLQEQHGAGFTGGTDAPSSADAPSSTGPSTSADTPNSADTPSNPDTPTSTDTPGKGGAPA